MNISTVGIQSWARRLEQDTRLFSKLTGMVTQRPTMLPHKTFLRPVHPFTGKLPITQTAGNRTSSKLGSSPLVTLRKDTTVKDVVIDLSECLRLCHRKNVEWLELTPSHHTEWLQYAHDYLISPMLQLFQQLRVREIKDDMFSHAEQDDDGIVKVWFTSLDFGTWEDPVYPPTIFITPRPFPSLVNTDAIARAVSPVLCHTRSNPTSKVIFTDLKTVLLIHPQTSGAKEVQVEIVSLKDDLRAFRIIAAAYLLDAMPHSAYLNPPKEPTGKYFFWLPPPHYDEKPLTDEEVFRTKHRNSDFNILKLSEDLEGALQFFRWKLHIEKHISPKITSAGDILECTTNEFDKICHPPRGVCTKPISEPTIQHMENILRPNPLSSTLCSTLKDSKHFTIKLGRALGDHNLKHAIARVHLCLIETIDDHPIQNCPELVMKVFDDRFMEVHSPYNEDGILEDNENLSPDLWFQSVLTAEWHVRGELTAFEKMKTAQGSLIPYFYGAHKFRLANGHEVFGILMEHVDAPPLDSGVTSKWSEEQQGQLMTSIRHGLRVIQCADISQHDWHGGQILCNFPPSSSQAHAVFIDFSATMQTVDLDVDLSKDDFGRCVSAITALDNTGLDVKWVCEYWDRNGMKRECWDAHGMGLMHHGYSWSSKAVDPYKFVYDGLVTSLDHQSV